MATRYSNLNDRKQAAKSFRGLMKLLVQHHEDAIRRHRMRLSDPPLPAPYQDQRPFYQRMIAENEVDLQRLAARRKRYVKYHSDRAIPADLRTQIADLEMELLRHEPGYTSHERQGVRYQRQRLAELHAQADRIRRPAEPPIEPNPGFRVGQTYTARAVTRAYDGLVWEVLAAHFEPHAEAGGSSRQVRVIALLPDSAGYQKIKERHFSMTLEAVVDLALEIIDELYQEMDEAFNNTPESLQGTSAGEARQAAAEQLEQVVDDPPSIPETLTGVRMMYYSTTRRNSRRDRANEAAAMFRKAAEVVRGQAAGPPGTDHPPAKELDECAESLEAAAEDVEAVYFPGMFG